MPWWLPADLWNVILISTAFASKLFLHFIISFTAFVKALAIFENKLACLSRDEIFHPCRREKLILACNYLAQGNRLLVIELWMSMLTLSWSNFLLYFLVPVSFLLPVRFTTNIDGVICQIRSKVRLLHWFDAFRKFNQFLIDFRRLQTMKVEFLI